MAYENRKYVIIESSEVGSVDFSEVMETSADTLRYSVDETQTFVKFEGDTPSFLDGKTQYAHSEILNILSGSEWNPPGPEEE
tara:strand:- start:243 stop:488 length:246 start_codon:yes stop_codon:yes gene_type:complete